MSHLLDQLLDARRAEECKADDQAQAANAGIAWQIQEPTPTTRRHPRTLEEAFPHEVPPVVDGPHKRSGVDIGHCVVVFVCVLFLVVLLVHVAMTWGQP